MSTPGQRIKEIAAKKGLPWGKALAAQFGVSYETLRRWTDGTAAPNRRRQELISTVLGVSASEFMFGSASDPTAAAVNRNEARLLRAYRSVLSTDKDEFLKSLERRAREVEEIELRIKTERGVFRAGRQRIGKQRQAAA